MLDTYTETELISHYRQINGLALTYNEASDKSLDTLLRQRLRTWYSHLLMTAPSERLPKRDVRGLITSARLITNGMMLTLPEEGVRPVSVKMPEWDTPVTRFYEPGSPAHLRQRDYWLQSTPYDPVAVLDGDTLYIYGIADRNHINVSTQMEHLIMTARPIDGTYQFDAADFPINLISSCSN